MHSRKLRKSSWLGSIECMQINCLGQDAWYSANRGGPSGEENHRKSHPKDHEKRHPESGGTIAVVEDVIRHHFIPTVTGRNTITDEERDLFSLPIRDGGLGITIPYQTSSQQRLLSQKICASVVEAVLNQQQVLDPDLAQKHASNKREAVRLQMEEKTLRMKNTVECLSSKLQRQAAIISQEGASSWLSSIPLKTYDFVLHKQAFLDAIALRYGWCPKDMPTRCECGKPFSIDHSLNCLKGGFPTLRHNKVRDLTASLLSEVCHDVRVEPHLQPLTGETIRHRTANTDAEARSDISACGFWSSWFEKVFMDVRIFNLNAKSYRNQTPAACFRQHKQEKRHQYNQHMREVEHASYSPLVFSTSGGMGKSTSIVYKRLAHLLSLKRNEFYSNVIRWLWCRLGFALVRAQIMCLRGCRSLSSHSDIDCPASIAQCVMEGRIPQS